MSSVATRPRSMTSSPSTPTTSSTRFSNFRPARYQTKEELDRFFGTTSAQKREQRLRVRETDGHVYFDWIEKDEWQHLLATGSLTSPNSPAERRRSSAATCMTLGSPLSPATPRRSSLASPSAPGMSPLAREFGDVGLGEARERRGRKRSSSNLVAASRGMMVDDEVALGGSGFSSKRRQSDGIVRRGYAEEDREEGSDEEEEEERIRINRLPLSRRKLDQETLDQAFGRANNPLLDLSPNATLLHPTATASRHHKPSALSIPPVSTHNLIEVETDCASPLAFDSSSARRGTFGSIFPPAPQEQQVTAQVLTLKPRHMRHQSDLGTPPSSAAMEFLATPTTSSSKSSSQVSHTRRHAVSFDTPRQAAFSPPQPVPSQPQSGWGQRQRWHSAGDSQAAASHPSEPKLRAARSVASLRERPPSATGGKVFERVRKISTSSNGSSCGSSDLNPCFTPLAPRTGAKKFDRTRLQHLNSLPSTSPSSTPSAVNISLPPMKDPIAPTTTQQAQPQSPPKAKAAMGTGLRTGPEVYDGVDIPCASIHLHSDPEDNFEPAVALNLTAKELKKMKKSKFGCIGGSAGGQGLARCETVTSSSAASVAGDAAQHAKGSSRWWSHILHG